MPKLLEEQRENWGTRAGFVLAAIGSAVGLGNLWGFPYKVYSHGGGAFLIPYLLAMILIGIPLLILEFSLGHMTQRAAPDAYRGINRKTEPIGWWGILLGFVIITYYPVILAYCGSFLLECIKGIVSGGELPWAAQGSEGVAKASEFFYQTYLNKWTPGDIEAGVKAWSFGRLVTPITISLAVMWAVMYLCICRGVRMVSKVVLLTVPLPWIMLFILTIRGMTLPGAGEGLNFFLNPNWSLLAEPETWRWAFGQMFFSMSLAFGVMVTYASFLHRKSDLNNNAAIVGLADVGTSFVAGIAVFATLGAMAFATRAAGAEVAVKNVVTEGPGLTFVAFPYALAQLPGSAWFGAVFFIALLTLGIDSAFSITESVLASIVDKTGWNRGWTLVGMTGIGFGLGLVYCTRGGLAWVGAMDDFINSTWGGITLLGLLECVVVGWAYRIKRLREHANERSDWKLGPWWDCLIRYVAPILLSGLFVWSLLERASKPEFLFKDGAIVLTNMVGLILAGLVPVVAVVLSLIHSPGANVHAEHVGQPRHGRAAGMLGTLLALAAFGTIGYAFYLAQHAAVRNAVMDHWQWGQFKVPVGWAIAGPAGLAALLALVLGAGAVHHGENHKKRPSGLARQAAGLGVIGLGSAIGVMLGMFLRLNPTSVQAAEQATEHLQPMSYVVLAFMLTLLVGGLGWCFYRAIKAAGAAAAEEQLPEADNQ